MARPSYRDALVPLLAARQGRSVLAVGLGRSYGDSGLNAGGCLIGMRGLDRIIAFDPERGRVTADAGLSLDALLQLIVPRGWFIATTPGTRFVTLGGAIANDVHGKNHHRAGTFGRCVRRLGLLRSDGQEIVLERDSGSDLFRATIGGLGLTGIISWAEIDLVAIRSAWLQLERIAFANTGEFFKLAQDSCEGFEHTVAWIDCAATGKSLGRGIFQRANWLADGDLQPHSARLKAVLPADAPAFALNGATVRAFNAAYFRQQASAPAVSRAHYGSVFYPLDAIGHWNRLYGNRGFYQYQCAIPAATCQDAIGELVRLIAKAGAGSFLAVLKTFGNLPSPGMLTFPMPGATLALDFPNKKGETLALFARLDAVVREAGGRLYPAKDGRMPGAMFRAGYPLHGEFAKHADPAFSSDFWRRVCA